VPDAIGKQTRCRCEWARRGSDTGAQKELDTTETTLSVIVVLLAEDDPGDGFLVREAFEFNEVRCDAPEGRVVQRRCEARAVGPDLRGRA
jgi:hypothetical protein